MPLFVQFLQSDDEPDDVWFSPTTGFLILGLLLFNIGCFLSPEAFDGLWSFFDIRHWQWWYYIVFGILAIFLLQYVRLCLTSEGFDDDPMPVEAIRRFRNMSAVVSFELLAVVFLHYSGYGFSLFRPFFMWSMYGTFSGLALILLAALAMLLCVTIYVVKEWFVTLFEQ